MRLRACLAAAVLAASMIAVSAPTQVIGMGRPGVNPVPCTEQAWEYGDAAFEPLPGAKAFFGRYEGGLYRLEIPGNWNGELALYAHGYVPERGRAGTPACSAKASAERESTPRKPTLG